AMLNQRVQSTMDEQSIAFITHPPRSALQPVAKEQTDSNGDFFFYLRTGASIGSNEMRSN
uniref:hypothetical protein n=1 Tax=Escherichia coli TaxID=562 RepID=UPI001F1D6219